MRIGRPDSATTRDAAGGGGGVRGAAPSSGRLITLLTGQEGSPNNYRVDLTQGDGTSEPASEPRHRQVIEQVRYLLGGYYSYAPGHVMATGQVAYFPESVFWGPQLRGSDHQMLVIQFGGPDGLGYPSFDQRRRGYEALVAKGGHFEDGMHVSTDEHGVRTVQDGYEALTEQILGRKVVYPPTRYGGPIVMTPENFEWQPDPHNAFLERKPLGTFTERDLRVHWLRLAEGGSLVLGTEAAPEILFVDRGTLMHDGDTYTDRTAFGTITGEPCETLTASSDTELLYVKLPTF
jgi:hypothetical protein